MINPTDISYNLDAAMRYGEMPEEALVKKREETDDLYDGEDAYENYARGIVKDWSPDAVAFESDETRRSYAGKGLINSRYYGGRGTENSPAHPEMFLGETDTDPRGTNVDPDMRLLREQSRARMRFIRFGADADNSVPESEVSNQDAFYRARILTQKMMQPRLKIFGTSKDGRREGIRREYQHKSAVNKVEEDMYRFRPGEKTFADQIADAALNPQRKTAIISNKVIRNSKLYHNNTTDHEFAVEKYGQDGRRRKLVTEMKSRVMKNNETAFAAEDTTQAYKSIGLLMGAIVQQKHKAAQDTIRGSNAEGHDLAAEVGRKSAALERDLLIVVREVERDGRDTGDHDTAESFKSAKQQRAKHLNRVQTATHAKPANTYLAAEMMYKSVKPGADRESIRHKGERDGKAADLREEMTVFGKASGEKIKSGKKESIMEVNGESKNAASYKSVADRVAKNGGVRQYNGEKIGSESRLTEKGKTQTVQHRVTTLRDVDPDTEKAFYDNYSKDRRVATMNTDKFGVFRYADRDSSINELI